MATSAASAAQAKPDRTVVFGASVGPFLAVALVIVFTPGPDMLLMAKHTLSHGRRAGLACGYGICAGLFVHAGAAAVGLSAILATSAWLYTAVKTVGAAYLVFIGLASLWSALGQGSSQWETRGAGHDRGQWSRFRQGLLTNVLNPKVAILFLSLLPQFVNSSQPVLRQTLALSGLFIIIGLVWVNLYVAALSVAGKRVLTTKVRRRVEAGSGVVLVLLGLRLLTPGR